MNGNNGITPTIELATTNGANGFGFPYAYPVYGNNNGNGFFDGDGIWAIVLLALLFNNGGFGGFGGGCYNNDFAWLSNGQKDIMTNTNNGFDTLHLSNQIEGVRDGIYGISNQLCNSTSDIVGAVNNGFANAETSANARQIANMQQAFNSQISTLQGFNNIGSRLDDCCCENRLGIANLNSTILAENCADRSALAEGIRDIMTNDTNNTRAILDKLCQLELDNVKTQLDAKNDRIADLQREISMKDLQASQIAQNSFIAQGLNNEVDALYNRLATCPINTIPVYGNQRIFTCPNNNSCGCGNFVNSQFI